MRPDDRVRAKLWDMLQAAGEDGLRLGHGPGGREADVGGADVDARDSVDGADVELGEDGRGGREGEEEAKSVTHGRWDGK